MVMRKKCAGTNLHVCAVSIVVQLDVGLPDLRLTEVDLLQTLQKIDKEVGKIKVYSSKPPPKSFGSQDKY